MIEISILLLMFSVAEQEPFTKEKTLVLKAFLPFLVIASHYCPEIITPVRNIQLLGSFAVSVFFFISGYGLSCKCNAINGRLKLSYFVNKVIGLLIPLIVIVSLYLLFRSIFLENPTAIDIISNLKKGYLVHPITWFVITLVNLYFIFYISSLVKKRRLLLLALLVIVLMVSQKMIDISGTYFMSDLAFVAGCAFERYENKLQKIPILLTKICYFLSVILMFIPLRGGTYINSFLCSICFIMLFCSVKQITSPIITFLAKISYELYLVQIIAAVVVNHYFERGVISFLLIVIMSVICASIINPFDRKVVKLVITPVCYEKKLCKFLDCKHNKG